MTNYKIQKKIERVYYKYKDYSWNQPRISSNGTMGGNDFACAASSVHAGREAYLAFDSDTNSLWHSTAGSPQWISWYNPKPIKITSLSLIVYSTVGGKLQGSNDNNTWTDIASFNGTSNVTVNTSTNTNYYKYHRLYCTSASYGYTIVNDITITGYYRKAEIGSSSNYDFFQDENVYSLAYKRERKYYKYSYSTETISSLPTFTLQQATYGRDGISFTPTEIYPAIGQSQQTAITNSYNYELIFTFAYGFVLKTWTFQGWVIANAMPTAGVSGVYGSNDKSTWTQISNNSSNTTKYTYYKVVLSGSEVGRYSTMGVTLLNMTGILTKRTVSPGTSSDYDAYEDVDSYYLMNI